ncbi:prolactin-like [Synchiropus splendidus]|uniref:prolactin-like n=1 Tax=Synchiropus splendidus TaxID=270530 RepID=UPI00237E5D4D|nr:prolactin-like [Synchiropus splendidus]
MTRAGLLVVSLLLLELRSGARAAPICHHGNGSCQVPSLTDLFDRVNLQSSRIHHISNDLRSQFEQHFPPHKNLIWRWKCHTHDIVTPRDKEDAQTLGREQLMEVVLRLLAAWEDPLWQLHRALSQSRHQNQVSSVKALQMADMVQELRGGVTRMAERMKLLGALSNTVGPLLPPSSSSFYQQGERHNDLLFCFRRDANKVQNYLRMLKCSSLPEQDC